MSLTDVSSSALCCVSLASGSSGNAYLISANGAHILIDCGISARRITMALRQLDIMPEELTAVLITHEHSDHIKGLETLAVKRQIPIYMSRGTFAGWHARVPRAADAAVTFLDNGSSVTLGALEVVACAASHDAEEPLLFTLASDKKRVGVCTDTGYVSSALMEHFRSCDLLYLESNYDVTMLWAGRYPWPLKQRIAGDCGHLSNDAAAEFAAFCIESGTRNVVLSHISQENNMPDLALLSMRHYLRTQGAEEHLDYSLLIAQRDELGSVFYL